MRYDQTRTDELDLMTKPVLGLTVGQRHERLMAWFVGEAYRQASNRATMAKCEQYYDLHQTDAARRREIERRGQTVVQWDVITPQIDWILGTERRMRIDQKVMPRRVLDDATVADAEAKTALLKWIDDTNYTGYERSAAWDDAQKAGQGWLEVFAKKDRDGWTVGKKCVPWKTCFPDSLGLEKTGTTNMRFFFRVKAVDLDIALMHFPDKRVEIMKCAAAADQLQSLQTWMSVPGQLLDLETIMGRTETDPTTAMPMDLFNIRQRVLLVECWSMEPFREPGGVSLNDPVRLRPRVTIMTEFDILMETWSPYRHDRIPFVPYWAYADKTTGLPYSLIRRLIDRQDALNKAMSRALHDISVDQLHIEADATDDEIMTLEEIRDELDDPAGIAIFARGALAADKVRVIKHADSAQAHMEFGNRIIQSVQESAAVNAESTGGGTPGVSGAALGRREDQSTLRTAELFDGLILSHILEGELTLSVVEQYMGAPMVVPTTDHKGAPVPLAINQYDPATRTYHNDITQQEARFVITEQPWRASLGQAQFESLMLVLKDLAGPAPQVVMALLDTVFEYADIPNKQQIVERIRSVTGQQAPDQRPTPEQIQMAQRKAAMDNAQFQHQLGMMQAQLQEAFGKAEQAGAKGTQLQADSLVKQLEAMGLAAAVAAQSAANPLLTSATDSILATVGFVDHHPAAGAALAHLPQAPAGPVNPAPAAAVQPLAAMTPPRPAPLPYPGQS